MKRFLKHIIDNKVSVYPLVSFRIVFGFVMLVSIIRFWLKGWIDAFYVQPHFFFKYYGFEWIKAPGETGIYILFAIMAIAALGIALGAFYRISSISFFVAFTYVELIDLTNYLNHYYFVSLIAFLLIWLPANKHLSIDARMFPNRTKPSLMVPAWTINIIKLQLGIVYFFAGVAKINPDWLLHAMPLKIWLPANTQLPVIGWLFDYEWVAYAFSWGGALFDLSIFFLLISKRTRTWGYVAALLFHFVTWSIFPIGMFPFIMMGCTLIFFSAGFHKKLLKPLEAWSPVGTSSDSIWHSSMLKPILATYIFIQLALPLRAFFYPGNLFWTEQGFRFSWRVMLMEKAGYATFKVKDKANGKTAVVDNSNYLTSQQERMMATQPDMILQYAQYLAKVYSAQGFTNPEVNVEDYVTLNGSGSRLYADPNIDLTTQTNTLQNPSWVLPYQP